MKYIFTLVCLLLMSSILRAEQISLMPKPIPAPTSMRVVMDIEQNESLSSKKAKEKLKYLAAEIKRYKDFAVHIIFHEKRAQSKKALRAANQIKNYLVKKKAIESNSIVLVRGEDNDIWKITIYLTPPEKPVEDSNGQIIASSEVLNDGTERKSRIQWTGYQNQPIKHVKTDPF